MGHANGGFLLSLHPSRGVGRDGTLLQCFQFLLLVPILLGLFALFVGVGRDATAHSTVVEVVSVAATTMS